MPAVAEVVVNGAMALHVTPASRLMSMFTVCPTPRVWENVMFLASPARQITAVFGAVTVMVGLPIVKSTSLMSVTSGFAAEVARILACVVTGPFTTQE